MDETKFPCVGMSAELQGTHAKHQLQYQNVCAKMFLDEMLGTEISSSLVKTDNSYQMQYSVFPFSHRNSSKTTGQKNPLQVTSDLQRPAKGGFSARPLLL